MDFCESENRSHIVETEKQLLETGLSTEFEEDLNMAIGEDTENEYEKHDEEDNIDNNEDSDQDSENDSLLSGENSIQDNSEEFSSEETNTLNIESNEHATDEEDETVNEESNHSNASEQSDDNEGLWEDIYGRQRDKEGNIVSKKYVPPAVRVTNNDISSDSEKISRLKKQMKGTLNRLAEQNMHTIANQVIDY